MSDASPGHPWYRDLTRYHWFVFVVAALGWLFDTMDQQLFTLARTPAMRELLASSPGVAPPKEAVDFYGPITTSVFLVGWAIGGLIFGVLGDRIGRAKTMLWTILIYSLCTGLSALSRNQYDFAFYRFITGLGVGGEFAVGVALVAEVMPDRSRAMALGWLQGLSAVGNITAAVIAIFLGQLEQAGVFENLELFGVAIKPWRMMFLVGTVPALLCLFIFKRLKEPERWRAAAEHGMHAKLGSYRELLGAPKWGPRAAIGLGLAFAGVVGLWGIGFFSADLIDSVYGKQLKAQNLSAQEIGGQLFKLKGVAFIMQNLGGFLGIYTFARVTHHLGRRATFAIFFVLAMLSTALVFSQLDEYHELYWMPFIMGFCQLALFGGYAIYLPELFPTRLRSTGTSFCYNVGRLVAAVGPFTFGVLNKAFAAHDEPMRYSGIAMCSIFLLGLLVLPFAPETKGQPLPE